MGTVEQIQADQTAALKAGDKPRLSVLRMLRARLQEAQLASSKPLDEAAVAEVLSRYAKQVRESIEGYEKAGRDAQRREAEAELAVVESYLPKPLSDEELDAIVRTAVAESGASGPKEMGKVMSLVMPQVKGRADGKKVNALVRKALGG